MRRSEAARARRSGRKRQRPVEPSETPFENRRASRSVKGNEKREQKGKSANAVRRKKMRRGSWLVKRRSSASAKSARSVKRKKRSADVGIENGSKKNGRKSACVLRKRGKSMRRAEKLASRRSVKRTLHESVAFRKSSSEIVEAVTEEVVLVAGLQIVIEIAVAEAETEVEVEAERGVGPPAKAGGDIGAEIGVGVGASHRNAESQ